MKKTFTSEDLNQITPESLEKMRKCDLIRFTIRLRNLGIDLYERLNLNSSNSSKPPSSDSPFKKKTLNDAAENVDPFDDKVRDEPNDDEADENQTEKTESDDEPKRKPGRQPGSQGFGREQKPEPQRKEHHYPEQCIICLKDLHEPEQPYMAITHTNLNGRKTVFLSYVPSIVIMRPFATVAMKTLKNPEKDTNQFWKDGNGM